MVLPPITRTRPERKGYDKLIYEQHLQRLENVSPTIDTSSPAPLPFVNKREITNKIMQNKIQKENNNMVERLINVASEKNKNIDNELDVYVKKQQIFKSSISTLRKKIELERITRENKRILERIRTANPTYNHLEWEIDAKHKDIIKKNMALYPEYYE